MNIVRSKAMNIVNYKRNMYRILGSNNELSFTFKGYIIYTEPKVFVVENIKKVSDYAQWTDILYLDVYLIPMMYTSEHAWFDMHDFVLFLASKCTDNNLYRFVDSFFFDNCIKWEAKYMKVLRNELIEHGSTIQDDLCLRSLVHPSNEDIEDTWYINKHTNETFMMKNLHYQDALCNVVYEPTLNENPGIVYEMIPKEIRKPAMMYRDANNEWTVYYPNVEKKKGNIRLQLVLIKLHDYDDYVERYVYDVSGHLHTNFIDFVNPVFVTYSMEYTMFAQLYFGDDCVSTYVPMELQTVITEEDKHAQLVGKFSESRGDFDDLIYQLYACVKIQRAWRRCVECPEYRVCKKRLLREFEELVN